ncbi:HerA-ATP synthase with barrel domain [Pyrolobus fumarii 1A]|uniref:HerA-ATP synthase with barrel domain n=1 Tax=Pyrolobus fumarii (strain DSM 11204 / 1A) TaxID=694429 RepID=G0EHQ6_PYRF1|nr:ATP-binding protein [Pyrolobus fumarii]AEM39409.1 HerA-ATP synthase with barrel domain [Pyrolobus fumarii 1A]
MEERPLGYVLDGATPVRATFVSSEPPKLGDYVVIRSTGIELLGFVENIGAKSVMLATTHSVKEPSFIQRLNELRLNGDTFFEARVRIVGDVNDPEFRNPRIPPPPGAPVYPAPRELLERIFGPGSRGYIRLGVLAARPDVPVYVDVNKMVTRHLAILAVTGAGKSNTVAVITDRIVRMGGTVLILDFHGEYVESDIGGGRVNVIEPRLNPRHLNIAELMILLGIESRYYHQERILRKAYARARESNEAFLDALRRAVEQLRGKEEPKALAAVLNKIEGLIERYRDILDEEAGDMLSRLRPGFANVLDLSRVDEDAADVIASHMLRRILQARKAHRVTGNGLPYPIFIVVEEAHILAPKDEDTLSKYWLARIAREGRKFGVGLCLVSQRPKNLDPDILSQANNKIILRIVEPSDQRYVQMATETLSDDLLEQLPSLNTGEAIVLGPMVRMPTLVRIDLYEGRKGGTDPDVVGEWLTAREMHQEHSQDPVLDLIEELTMKR